MTRADIKIGDRVKLFCPQILNNTRSGNTIIGIVIDVFDALLPDGSEGALEIDIAYQGKWVRYKPNTDGGTITIINE